MTPTFALPLLLWLLLLPLALLAWEIAHTRRAGQSTHPKILRGRAGARDFQLLGGQPERFARARPRVWLCLGLALTVVALARPQYGLLEEQVFDQSREILIAVDLSKSMLAEDVKPSRLGRAKLLIQSLLERLAGERVGLVLFSGTAFVQSPLSADYEILNEFLPVLEPGYLPAGGTNYSALLHTANESFGPATTADRFLIILSDGEATDEQWREELPGLKERGIRVIGLGVGTGAGSMIPDGSGGFIKDERGAVVMSKLENATLQELAKETNGAYEDASGWVDIAALMQGTVEAGQKGAFKRETRSRLVERYQWALAPALLLLLISYWREFPARPKPRELRLLVAKPAPARSGSPAVAAMLTAALILAAADPALRAASLDPRSPAAARPPAPAPAAPPAAGDPGPPEENPVQVAAAPLAKAVDRISRQTRRAAADWAELARLTINYGQQLLTANTDVPEAPVRDALQAVELGAALDPKAADWPTLKQQLEELLKKKDEPPPEEPPPPPPDQQNQEQQKQSQPGDSQSNGGQPQEKSDQNQDPSKENQDQDKQDQEQPDQEKKENADSAFGDMDEPQPEEQNPQNQPPPKNETQQVGGQQQQARNENPSLTVPLQHLDELRNRDNPADLFQLMDDQPPPKPTGKDW
jgi:Ca-activated chloride channel family protein